MPPLPHGLAHVWHWYGELVSARGSADGVPAPVGYPEIGWWAALTRRSPTPAEVEALVKLDLCYRATRAKVRANDA